MVQADQLLPSCVENKGLFSKHYLENQLQQTDEWKSPKNMEEAFKRIKALYGAKSMAILNNADESQLRDIFLNPVLNYLGHHHRVGSKTATARKFPDYGLFPDESTADEAIKHQGHEDFYKKAISVCEAKAWSIKLDERDTKNKDPDKRVAPNWQIDNYLRLTRKKWGVLTNGRFWRLYCEGNSYQNYYYQIDLVEIIENGDIDAFRFFYVFFQKDAFEIDTTSACFLDNVYQKSIDYAKEIGENLEENVYKAMKILAEGFIKLPQNKITKSEDDLKVLQENIMNLLYRLLFIFFAEARGLLDISGQNDASKNYAKEYSLDSLKKQIRSRLEKGEDIPEYAMDYWGKLQTLFEFIDKGTEASSIPRDKLYIPTYNGGLFDKEKNRFLSEKKIGDYHLAKAIDLLARTEGKKPEEKGFVDYSSLDIRHLGSIYEGLLEYKLKAATEPMVAVKEKRKEKWIKQSEFNGKTPLDKVDAGEIYLATDKGERKATGSYYTPEYIVKYIVENTLKPIVEEKMKTTIKNNKKCLDAILSIKALDPAMGSGHFLVEVVDFLARHLGDAINNDIERKLIPEGEYPDDWLRREIVSHCVYGVDLNPMAVELAKVSLWLKTISKDKPLSFLDHRLKCGNSLIGAELADIHFYPETKGKAKKAHEDKTQQRLPSPLIEKLLEGIRQIDAISDENLEAIKIKEGLFEKWKETEAYRRIKALADIRTAIYFGCMSQDKRPGKEYGNLTWAIFKEDSTRWEEEVQYGWKKEGLKIAEQKRFFHWELEFPEIFFEGEKTKETPGFDAVVGNPPYVSIEKIDKTELSYLEKRYKSAIYGRTDLYIVFIELSNLLSRKGANFSLITPDKWLVSDYGEILRMLLLTENKLMCIWDLRNVKVFEDAKNSPIVFIVNKSKRADNTIEFIIGLPDQSNYLNYRCPQSLFLDSYGFKIKIGLTDEKWKLIKKISSNSDKLGDFCYASYGAQPGLLSKFVFYDKDCAFEGAKKLGEEQNFAKIVKPFIKGGNVARYEIDYDNGLMLYLPDKLHRPAFPELFENNKIVISEIANHLKATFDDKGFYGNEKVVFVVSAWSLENLSEKTIKQRTIPQIYDIPTYTKNYNLRHILTLTNSQLMDFYFTNYIGDLLNVYPDDVRLLPIRRIPFTTSDSERKLLVEKAKKLYGGGLAK